jgi:hypothetical protein
MWDLLGQYYGLDWVATGFSLASIYFLGDHRRAGFSAGMIGAVLWAAFGILASSVAGTLLNVLLCGLFLRGYLRWKPQLPPAQSRVPTAIP